MPSASRSSQSVTNKKHIVNAHRCVDACVYAVLASSELQELKRCIAKLVNTQTLFKVLCMLTLRACAAVCVHGVLSQFALQNTIVMHLITIVDMCH